MNVMHMLNATMQIYGMDASSGAAVSALDVSPGDHVLDLCAAPGNYVFSLFLKNNISICLSNMVFFWFK